MKLKSSSIGLALPDKTQSMLKAGARAYDKNLSNGNTAQVKWTSICQYCKGSNDSKEMTKCFFCEKDICVYCYNFCFKCEQHFCPLCSIIRYKANLFFLVFFFCLLCILTFNVSIYCSYNDHKEKSYCLSCHHLAKM